MRYYNILFINEKGKPEYNSEFQMDLYDITYEGNMMFVYLRKDFEIGNFVNPKNSFRLAMPLGRLVRVTFEDKDSKEDTDATKRN